MGYAMEDLDVRGPIDTEFGQRIVVGYDRTDRWGGGPHRVWFRLDSTEKMTGDKRGVDERHVLLNETDKTGETMGSWHGAFPTHDIGVALAMLPAYLDELRIMGDLAGTMPSITEAWGRFVDSLEPNALDARESWRAFRAMVERVEMTVREAFAKLDTEG